MTIKSEKAKEYLSPENISHHDIGVGDSLIVIDILDAKEAILISENEVEELHSNELQELKDKAIHLYRLNCPCFSRQFYECISNDKDSFCDMECDYIKNFTNELNK